MRLMLERNRFELHFGIINKTEMLICGAVHIASWMITEQNITSVLKMARRK